MRVDLAAVPAAQPRRGGIAVSGSSRTAPLRVERFKPRGQVKRRTPLPGVGQSRNLGESHWPHLLVRGPTREEWDRRSHPRLDNLAGNDGAVLLGSHLVRGCSASALAFDIDTEPWCAAAESLDQDV